MTILCTEDLLETLQTNFKVAFGWRYFEQTVYDRIQGLKEVFFYDLLDYRFREAYCASNVFVLIEFFEIDVVLEGDDFLKELKNIERKLGKSLGLLLIIFLK